MATVRQPAGGPASEPFLARQCWRKWSAVWSSPMAGNTIGRQAAAINVGTFERIGSTLMGMALISRATGRPSLRHLVLAIGGAALLQRGLTGHCAAYQRLGVSTALREEPELDAVSRA